jgi:hypothetical protein
MLEFVRRNRVLLSSGLFLLCSLGLLSANARQPGRIDPLGHIFLEVMAPFQRLTAGIAGATRGFWDHYVVLVGVQQENERLRAGSRVGPRNAPGNGLMNRRLKRLLALNAS